MIKNNIYNITLTIIISLLLINCNDNKSETLPKNNLTPTVYSYEIINVYPHDINAYTQGLEFYNGFLYESIGRYGKSQLRRVDYESGEVLSTKNINKKYFAEGITILDDLIYLLSWREKIGFIYDVNNFNIIDSFSYDKSKEGWGLCNDGKNIYKSDGTDKIWILDPKSMKELDYIQPHTNKRKLANINELEWINDRIYGNIYMAEGIAIINPKNGVVEGVIDLSSLKEEVTNHKDLDVLNGIAYNKASNSIFVTGKMWDKLFEIKITPKTNRE